MHQLKEYQQACLVEADLTEWGRQILQSRVISLELGGLFPEQQNLSEVHDVLDLACGAAGWTLEAAEAYPQMHFTGIDSDPTVLEYAQARSWADGKTNVDFEVMDVTQPFQIEENRFDFIYGRFLSGFMRRQDWPRVIGECRRVLRPGGILLFTESDAWVIDNAPAMARLQKYFYQALWLAELAFCADGYRTGVSPMLSFFLKEAGYEQVSLIEHTINCSYGARAYPAMVQDTLLLTRHLRPFLERTGVATAQELEWLFHRGLEEIKRKRYRSFWHITQVFGRKPYRKSWFSI